MKKFIAVFLFCAFVVPAGMAEARSVSIMKQPNNRANYIRLVSSGRKDKELQLNQPYTFTEMQMANILRSLRYNRRALFSDKIKYRNVWEEEYIERYVPLLVKAFAEAKPDQDVLVSVAQKRPYYIVRNDRLTQTRMWITGQELHIRFFKTEAQLLGDYKAYTQAGKKQIDNAKGLRISLEPQEGQKFAFDSIQEIILDLNTDWSAVVAKIEEEEVRLKAEKDAKFGRKKKAVASSQSSPAYPVSEKDRKSAEDRLSELKKLKDKGLINDQDYEKKKQEILQSI